MTEQDENSGTNMNSNQQKLSVTSILSGSGMFLPDEVIPNSYFESYLDTSDEWISSRTGIKERRWAKPGTGASSLALPAAEQAISNAGLSVQDIDGIVFATCTPDNIFPSSGAFLQKKLGMKRGYAFDINSVCSGFVYAMTVADSMIKAGQGENILVVGSEVYSSIINKQDRTTCILFGDGAGAVVLSKSPYNASENVLNSENSQSIRGIYNSEIHADGTYTDILCVPNGSAAPVTAEKLETGEHLLYMEGREVFKLAVRGLADVSKSVVKNAGLTTDDVDFIVSHQANKRILEAVGKQMKVPAEKMLMNVEKYGNTSAASIPILLAESISNDTIKQGNLVLLSAFGGGVSWGATLIRI